MARELRAMAAECNLGFLAYLLSMVEDEAGTVTKSLAEKQAAARSAAPSA